MDELIRLVAKETGLSEDKAKIAVETVIGFLKQKLPTIATQIDDALSGSTRNMAYVSPESKRAEEVIVVDSKGDDKTGECAKLVTRKTGLPEDKAKMAVEIVVGFLKQKLPAAVAARID
jgi:ribosomal protein L31E